MLSPALPVKDALRGLRTGFSTGMTTGRKIIAPLLDTTPRPVADLMRDIAHRAEQVTPEVEHATSRLVHLLLDRPGAGDFRGWSLARMVAEPAGAEVFAARLYHGVDRAFRQLGLPPDLLSEMRAAQAFDALRQTLPHDDLHALAAELLLGADERMFAPPPPFAARAAAEDRRLALFGVMLWLLADDGSDEDEEALLGVCLDAAMAVGRQVSDLPRDRAALRGLLFDYARLI